MKGSVYHGQKYDLPDKFWPVTLDNFFDNPDEIRELGLRLLKSDKVITPTNSDDPAKSLKGRWPGYRSQMLWKIDEDLTQRIIKKILSCYFNLDLEQISWNFCDIQFQLIPNFDKDKNNIKNKGWIHRDGVDPREKHWPKNSGPQSELAGLIYLTPDIERDTGTSLFNIKKDKTLDDWDETVGARMPLYSGDPVNDEELKEKWEKHRSCFIEKIRFENIYNRLIMYDVKEFHAANSYYSSKDARLILVFFIGGILSIKSPLERIGNI